MLLAGEFSACWYGKVGVEGGYPTMRTDRTCSKNVEFSLWCSLRSRMRSAGVLQHEERSFGMSVFSCRHFPQRDDRERGMMCPNRRPPRRNMLKMGCCGRGGLRFGTIPGERASGVHVGAHMIGACNDVMPRTHRSAMRQDAMTSTPFTCTMLDNASMNCLMILRLRPFCMRLGMPFVAQETSTVTPCS